MTQTETIAHHAADKLLAILADAIRESLAKLTPEEQAALLEGPEPSAPDSEALARFLMGALRE